jgi:L-methionine (R)-S-oxide reductase
MNAHPLARRIEKHLSGGDVGAALDEILTHFDCSLGTIHRLSPASGLLELVIHRGMPEAMIPRIQLVPLGKGMAGLAAQRRECVSLCNLQTDTSGAAQPGAKLTGMEGSIAVPMIVDGEVRGVLGVAKPTTYEFDEAQRRLLLQLATMIGKRFGV